MHKRIRRAAVLERALHRIEGNVSADIKAPRRGRGELVLYLDYDGVLHYDGVFWTARRGIYLDAPPGHRLFEHVPLLEQALAPHPEVRIVLSTSWVVWNRYHATAKQLGPALQRRVIGATWHAGMRWYRDSFTRQPRGSQVWQDVQRRQPRDWLAIDDEVHEWSEQCVDKLVRSDSTYGLGNPAVLQELKDKLAAMCRVPPS